jgi:protein-S-isoprenylcysteine O-methyltransferase Ste14
MTADQLPVAVLVACIWTYWVGAMRMVVRVRRKSRKRTAGLVPRQTLERALWALWVPAVIAWLALPAAALVSSDPPLAPAPEWTPPTAIRWLGAAVAAAALLATMRCWKIMGRSWRMGVIPGERTELVTRGIYARVRHPIYTLSLLLMAATVVVLPTAPIAALAVVHVGLLWTKARNEERFLLDAHGSAYTEYLERTGGFLPRLRGPRRAAES